MFKTLGGKNTKREERIGSRIMRLYTQKGTTIRTCESVVAVVRFERRL